MEPQAIHKTTETLFGLVKRQILNLCRKAFLLTFSITYTKQGHNVITTVPKTEGLAEN